MIVILSHGRTANRPYPMRWDLEMRTGLWTRFASTCYTPRSELNESQLTAIKQEAHHDGDR